MDWIYPLILVAAVLVVFSVLTSLVAFRFGAPLLLVFLAIGLIAGEDGLGLALDDMESVYLIGSVALAVILFDSGFGTPLTTLRRAAAPAFVLASLGVLLTTLIAGVAARWLFDLPWFHAFLMGAIVSSTDAAAVFFLLRAGGVQIFKRVRSVLEVESGSNDPMAIFLVVLFIELILTGADWQMLGPAFVRGFMMQLGMGLIIGLVAGFLIVELVNRIRLEEALYPIAVMATALAVFGFVGQVGGSGFLAVYVAGVVAGNRRMTGSARLRRYQSGMTWLAQIVMFVMLGLAATPSEFVPILLPALAFALFLAVVARPVAVLCCLRPFAVSRASTAFTAWVGLRGAVSILLGALPMVAGIEGGELFFNVAFIVVLASLLVQGWTITPLAGRLRLSIPPGSGPVDRIDIEVPGTIRHELVVYRVESGSEAATRDRLPRWAHPAMLVRNGRKRPFRPGDGLQAGDFVYVFCAPEYRRMLDRVFAHPADPFRWDGDILGWFRLEPTVRLGELLNAYGMAGFKERHDQGLDEFMAGELDGQPVIGDRVALSSLRLVVRQIDRKGRIIEVGLVLEPGSREPQESVLASLRHWCHRHLLGFRR